jgi:hypothetical protein
MLELLMTRLEPAERNIFKKIETNKYEPREFRTDSDWPGMRRIN